MGAKTTRVGGAGSEARGAEGDGKAGGEAEGVEGPTAPGAAAEGKAAVKQCGESCTS